MSTVNCYERGVQTVQLVGITAQWVCRLSSLCLLFHNFCADCPGSGFYCTVVVQTVQYLRITTQWLADSSQWELLQSGCADSSQWELLHSGCVDSSQWKLLHSGSADCPGYGYYCTVVVQTDQSMGITAQWLCTLQLVGITAQWLCRWSRLWVLLHNDCADCPVSGFYCIVVGRLQSVGIGAQWLCRLQSMGITAQWLCIIQSVEITAQR